MHGQTGCSSNANACLVVQFIGLSKHDGCGALRPSNTDGNPGREGGGNHGIII